jgi:hypothetical protein
MDFFYHNLYLLNALYKPKQKKLVNFHFKKANLQFMSRIFSLNTYFNFWNQKNNSKFPRSKGKHL